MSSGAIAGAPDALATTGSSNFEITISSSWLDCRSASCSAFWHSGAVFFASFAASRV